MNDKRKTNFDLLKIIAIIFIIIHHVIFHGKILQNCNTKSLYVIFSLIEYLVIIGVNLFILITGYFQSNKDFRPKKIWQLIGCCLFYKAFIIILFANFKIMHLNIFEIIKEIFIFKLDTYNSYWFVVIYLFLYCLSPFLNKLINSLSQKEYKNLLFITTIIFSIIPSFTISDAFIGDGYTLYNFIYLYLIGAYIRIYTSTNKYKDKTKILIFLTIIYPIINFSSTLIFKYLVPFSNLSIKFYKNSFNYNNPIVILQSVTLFLLFSTFNLKSKIINTMSKLTLGIYLMHDNKFIRNYIYKYLKIDNGVITSFSFIFYVLLISLIIFLFCAIIEWSRQKILKFMLKSKKTFTNY